MSWGEFRVKQKVLRGETIVIDGKAFRNTVFESCIFIYRGGERTSFEGCVFQAPEFRFEGAASNTLAFMRALYHGGAAQLIEYTFDDIRDNKPVRITLN